LIRAVRRVLIIGCGGAGKSTLARRLAERTGLPLVHLDAHFWRAGWQQPPSDEWHRVVDGLIAGERWIQDGNYSGTLDVRLAACDTAVFLDLPTLVCLWGILSRWWRYRGRARPDLPDGCPEQLSWEFIAWVWRYRRRSRPTVLARLRAVAGDKQVVILRSRRAMDHFIATRAPADPRR
jgi:adenylate kinase family enzyme